MLQQSLLYAAVCIGVTACLMTWAAMKLGNRLSAAFGRRMETVGGVILITIGVKLLL
jgi:putative Mn2+ efflux pump MntP